MAWNCSGCRVSRHVVLWHSKGSLKTRSEGAIGGEIRYTGPSIPAVTCAPPAVRVAYPPVGDVTGHYPVLQDDGKIPVPPADGGALVTPRP